MSESNEKLVCSKYSVASSAKNGSSATAKESCRNLLKELSVHQLKHGFL